ncbi:putative phage abortive infection protein [Providencia stuartii]
MRRFFIYLFAIIGVLGVITNIILSITEPRYFDDIWKLYNENSVPFIGLFTILGALVTLFIFSETAKATENAAKSLKLTQETLKTTMENNRKDDFIKQFILLLELHGKSHDVLADYLKNNKVISSNSEGIINWNMSIEDATGKLFKNHLFSPYMRLVYRILKYVDENFYHMVDGNLTASKVDEEKKQYTSIVRSTIRNDVLFFIALNSLNEKFSTYKDLLNKFDFFEHLNTRYISDDIIFNLESYSPSLCSIPLWTGFDESLIKEALNYHIYPELVKKKGVNKFQIQLPNTFHIDIMRNYAKEQYNDFLKDIESKINPYDIVGSINEYANRFNFINLKFYCYNVCDAIPYDEGYRSNKFKLRRNGTKSIDEMLEKILLTEVSKDNFRVFKRNKKMIYYLPTIKKKMIEQV